MSQAFGWLTPKARKACSSCCAPPYTSPLSWSYQSAATPRKKSGNARKTTTVLAKQHITSDVCKPRIAAVNNSTSKRLWCTRVCRRLCRWWRRHSYRRRRWCRRCWRRSRCRGVQCSRRCCILSLWCRHTRNWTFYRRNTFNTMQCNAIQYTEKKLMFAPHISMLLRCHAPMNSSVLSCLKKLAAAGVSKWVVFFYFFSVFLLGRAVD